MTLKKFGMMHNQVRGIHGCLISIEYGDWRIDGKSANLDLSNISHLLKETEIIDHKEIGWKGMHLPSDFSTSECLCCNGERYEKCDISYSGILAKNAPNPYNKKYRMIDGKHRIAKMREMGITKSSYYVLEYAIIKAFLKFNE